MAKSQRDEDPLVALQSVIKVYPGPPSFEALSVTRLDVSPGEFVAVTGPSGSGKSTLLNILGLLDRPTSGRYRLAGTDVAALTDRQRSHVRHETIGFVFQSCHLLPGRTVLENVELPLMYGDRPSGNSEALELLDRLGIEAKTHVRSETLSGGEKQRTALARALIAQPRLLLCDEPTGNLDTSSTEGVLDILRNLHSDGLTIIVITHDLNVASVAQRRLHIRDGEISDA